MTREEHIKWCKERAIQELEYTHDPKQGIVSMLSDIGKHPETNSQTLKMLCMAEMMSGRCTEQSVRKFIDGFN
jgi:hypothetical protein